MNKRFTLTHIDYTINNAKSKEKICRLADSMKISTGNWELVSRQVKADQNFSKWRVAQPLIPRFPIHSSNVVERVNPTQITFI